MGLILNGTIGNNRYEDQQVSAKELMDIFGIRDDLKRLGKVIRFDLADRKIRKQGNETLHPQQQAVLCMTNGTHEGEHYELLYYKQRTRKDGMNSKTIVYDYKPRKIYIQGVSHAVNTAEDLELAVFMYIHNDNVDSPTRKQGTRYTYKLHDNLKQAEDMFKHNTLIFNITQRIMNDDINALKLKAQGLKLGNFAEKTDVEVRSTLLEHFEKYKMSGRVNKFVEEFNSPYSTFTGIIMEAVQRGILQQKADKGQFVYVWGTKTDQSGKVACKIPKGEMPIEYLVKYAQANYEMFLKTIEQEIKKDEDYRGLSDALSSVYVYSENELQEDKPVSSTASTPHEMNLSELVDKGLTYGVIEYNRSDKNIYFIKDEEYELPAILSVNDSKKWKEELTLYLNGNEGTDVQKSMRKKLHGKMLGELRTDNKKKNAMRT